MLDERKALAGSAPRDRERPGTSSQTIPAVCQRPVTTVGLGPVVNDRLASFSSQRALVALVVTVLQLVSVFHLALVPHAYSMAGGGLVHVHRAPRLVPDGTAAHADDKARRATVECGSASSVTEQCPLADAPHGSPASLSCLASGSIVFGASQRLMEAALPRSEPLLRLLRAPKTSPPV